MILQFWPKTICILYTLYWLLFIILDYHQNSTAIEAETRVEVEAMVAMNSNEMDSQSSCKVSCSVVQQIPVLIEAGTDVPLSSV